MNKHIPCLAAACLIASLLSHSSANEPILDIVVRENGEIVDQSPSARPLRVDPGHVQVEEDSSAVLDNGGAIVIPFDSNDPLFSSETFTWMLEMRLQENREGRHNIAVAGRWDIQGDQRAAGLVLDITTNLMQFLVSPNGTAETTLAPQIIPMPFGEWVTFVAVYDPPVFSLGKVDSQGNFQPGPARSNAPQVNPESTADFRIGGPSWQPLHFRRLRVWSSALDGGAIDDATTR